MRRDIRQLHDFVQDIGVTLLVEVCAVFVADFVELFLCRKAL